MESRAARGDCRKIDLFTLSGLRFGDERLNNPVNAETYASSRFNQADRGDTGSHCAGSDRVCRQLGTLPLSADQDGPDIEALEVLCISNPGAAAIY